MVFRKKVAKKARGTAKTPGFSFLGMGRLACGGENVLFAAETEMERKLFRTAGAVVIKFWDGKSHLGEDAFSKAARKMGDGAKFVCVKIKDRKLKEKYGLKHSPTFIFFEAGKEKSRIEGPSPSEALEVWCELNSA